MPLTTPPDDAPDLDELLGALGGTRAKVLGDDDLDDEDDPSYLEPLEGEGPRPYEAFTRYRDMGPDRSLEAVSRELSKSVQLLKRWSAKYQWVDRAAQYDGYMAYVRGQAIEAEHTRKAHEWVARRWQTLEEQYAFGEAVVGKARELIAPAEGDEPITGRAFRQAVLLGELGFKLRREACERAEAGRTDGLSNLGGLGSLLPDVRGPFPIP